MSIPRVYIYANGTSARMLVSMPGIDVTGVMAPDEVIFDDNYSGLDVLAKGFIPAGASSSTISYGVTLSAPPMCLFYVDQNYTTATPYLVGPMAFRGGGFNDWFYVETGLSSANFLVQYGSVFPPFWYLLIRRRP